MRKTRSCLIFLAILLVFYREVYYNALTRDKWIKSHECIIVKQPNLYGVSNRELTTKEEADSQGYKMRMVLRFEFRPDEFQRLKF